jgi:hypothetical protein
MRSFGPAPDSAAKITETPYFKLEQGLEKQLSKADMAAAATRARMAEIMGPWRRQVPSAAAKEKGVVTSSECDEVISGDGDKDLSEVEGYVETNLMD